MLKYSIAVLGVGAFLATTVVASQAADAIAVDNYNYNESYDAGPKDWSGNYVGAQIGASSSKFPSPFSDRTGALMGVVAGRTVQSGKFVMGGELEANFAEAEHRIGRGGELQQSWNGNAKAKAGVALDQTLVYGTLGYGATKFKDKGNTTKGPGWEGGVVLGGGVEQVVSGPLSVKAEYNYQRFSGVKSEVNGVDQKNNLNNHSLKAGLNYRFN